MHLRINTNSSCNIRCKHCYYDAKVGFNGDILELDDAKSIVDQAYEIWGKDLNIVIMGGGEPLLYPYLFDLIEYISNKNINISITTNGLLLDSKNLEIFKKYNVLLNISIEGTEEYNNFIRGEGTFLKIIKSISLVQKIGVKYSINFVLTKNNIISIPFIIKLFSKTSEYITFSRYIPYIKNEKIEPLDKKDYLVIDEILDKYKNDKLRYRQEKFFRDEIEKKFFKFDYKKLKSIYILPSKKVFPAWNLIDYELGNLNNHSLKDILINGKYEKLINPDNLNGDYCKNCTKKYNCGGDRGVAYFYKGNFWGDDPQCPFYKK